MNNSGRDFKKSWLNHILSGAVCLILSVMIAGCTQQKSMDVYKDSTVTQFFQRTSGWVAGDGAFSVPLSDGRTFWTMGDSFIDTYDEETGTIPCLFNVNNAGLLQPENNWDWTKTKTLDSKNPDTKTFFTDTTDNGDWYWPVSGIQLDDTVYVYYSGVEHASGGLGFAPTGKDVLAKLKFPEMEITGYDELQDFNNINFGVGFVEDKESGYVYIFGHQFLPELKQNDMYVARSPFSNLSSAWEFWDGEDWGKAVTHAVPVKEDAGFTPMMTRVKDKYLLISSEYSVGCDQGKEIYAATSDQPTGPFSEARTIHTIDDTLQGHYPFFYVPVAHPQFVNDEEEILITYNINGYGDCVEGCVENKMDPNHYRPRGVRVPLELIDPEL